MGVAAAVHLALGSPEGVPARRGVGTPPRARGHATAVGAGGAPGVGGAHFGGATSGPIDVSLYGRDAHDAQLVAKLLRFVFYRGSGPTLTITRSQQVEHEAYLTLLAARAGVRAPDVAMVAGTAGPAGDALLVTRPPPGRALADLLPESHDPPADGAGPGAEEGAGPGAEGGAPRDDPPWPGSCADTQLARPGSPTARSVRPRSWWLTTARRSGRLPGSGLDTGAPGERTDRDLASALATMALAVGAERTARTAASVLPPQDLAAARSFLQRAALSPALSRRCGAARPSSTTCGSRPPPPPRAAPKLAEPRRISWVNLVIVVGSIMGAGRCFGRPDQRREVLEHHRRRLLGLGGAGRRAGAAGLSGQP